MQFLKMNMLHEVFPEGTPHVSRRLTTMKGKCLSILIAGAIDMTSGFYGTAAGSVH